MLFVIEMWHSKYVRNYLANESVLARIKWKCSLIAGEIFGVINSLFFPCLVVCVQSLSLFDLRDCSTPASSLLGYLPLFAQIHAHWVWCYLIISSSAIPLPFCSPSFPASGSFLRCRLFASGGQSIALGGQSIGASTSTTALPAMNSQGWFPLGLTGVISLLPRESQEHHNLKASILQHSAFFMVQLSYLFVTTVYCLCLINKHSRGCYFVLGAWETDGQNRFSGAPVWSIHEYYSCV